LLSLSIIVDATAAAFSLREQAISNRAMSYLRDKMIVELKQIVVPVLRELRFKGSFPHFRREVAGRVDLLTFQFSSAGGRFVVEIGKFAASGYVMGDRILAANQVKISHLSRRLRLGAKNESVDHWFDYESEDRSHVATAIESLIRGQAEQWWCAD
jgi:hypothetical protein